MRRSSIHQRSARGVGGWTHEESVRLIRACAESWTFKDIAAGYDGRHDEADCRSKWASMQVLSSTKAVTAAHGEMRRIRSEIVRMDERIHAAAADPSEQQRLQKLLVDLQSDASMALIAYENVLEEPDFGQR